MIDPPLPLMLALDVVSLTMTLVNAESPTGEEGPLADQVEVTLAGLPHLTLERLGHTVVARTDAGHGERVVLAGHLDAPPSDDEVLARVEMGRLYGPGACDAKGGVAIMLRVAALAGHARDVTLVFYDRGLAADEGLRRVAEARPELLRGDLAMLLSPTGLERVDTAVAPLDALGVPTLAYGPGDPQVAGTPEEYVPTAHLTEAEHAVRTWLQDGTGPLA